MSHAILGMFMPKKYVFGSKFQMQLGMLSVCLSHLAALCTHRSHIPARAFTGTHRAHGHAQHRKSCVFRRGASPARAQKTSHAPLLPKCLRVPSTPPGPGVASWGPFLPSSSGNPPWLAAWSGSRGLGHGFPLAQPAAAPLSPGPPCPPQRLCCQLAGWWPSSEQASSLQLPGCSYAGLRAPGSRRACRRNVLRFLLASPSRWGGGPWGLPETLYWGRPSRRPPDAPDGPRRPAAISRGIWFLRRGLCLAWQRLRPSRCSPRGPERPVGGGGGGEPPPRPQGHKRALCLWSRWRESSALGAQGTLRSWRTLNANKNHATSAAPWEPALARW